MIPRKFNLFVFNFIYTTRNLGWCFVPGLDLFNLCYFFSESILPYFGLFSVLNTDNCHAILLVITIFVYTYTRSVSKHVHVSQIKRKMPSLVRIKMNITIQRHCTCKNQPDQWLLVYKTVTLVLPWTLGEDDGSLLSGDGLFCKSVSIMVKIYPSVSTVCFSTSPLKHPFIKNAKPVTILREMINEANENREKEKLRLQAQDEEDDEDAASVSNLSCLLCYTSAPLTLSSSTTSSASLNLPSFLNQKSCSWK